MTYHKDIKAANENAVFDVLDKCRCFGCNKFILRDVIAYDGFVEDGYLKHVFMHRDCAFAMAQRMIIDAWPMRDRKKYSEFDHQNAFNLIIEYDEKRCGYFVNGDGFDFFAYFTDDEEDHVFIECSSVQRLGSDQSMHLQFPYTEEMKNDPNAVERAIQRALIEYWIL